MSTGATEILQQRFMSNDLSSILAGFKLKYENVVDFDEWNSKILKVLWAIISIIFVVTLINYIGIYLKGEHWRHYGYHTYMQILMYLFIIPFGLATMLIATTIFTSKILAKKKYYCLQAFMTTSCVTCIALIVNIAYYRVNGLFMVFAISCLFSLIYIDRKPIIFATVTNILAYSMTYIFFLAEKAKNGEIVHRLYPEVTATIAFILAVTLITSYILTRQKILINNILVEKYKSRMDSLTNFFNHATFYEMLDYSIVKSKSEKAEPLSITIMDIDNFKMVNDEYGHAIGDQVILALVKAVKKSVFEGVDEVFRYGGEEFAIISKRNAEDTYNIVEMIRIEFEKCSKMSDYLSGTTVSCGICDFSTGEFNGKREFFAAADEALYKAKRAGKNRTVVYE